VIRLWILAPLFVLCGQQDALAHSTIAGTKGFYAGVLHPVVVPAHLLVLAAASLWIGQHDERMEKQLLGFAIFLAIGSTVGVLHPFEEAGPLLLLVAMALGLLVAAERSLPGHVGIGLAALVALVVGIDSAPNAGDTFTARIFALVGTFIGVHLIVLNLVAIVSSNRKPWVTIGFRILGSWIAASAILVLAFALKP
jgi:urease accessory protein